MFGVLGYKTHRKVAGDIGKSKEKRNAMRAHSHDSNDRSHDHIWIMDILDMLCTKRVQIPYNFNGKYG